MLKRLLVVGLVVGLTVAVALLGLLVVGLLRGHAEILRALHHLGVDLDPARAGTDPGPVAVALSGQKGRPTPSRPGAGDVIDLTGVAPNGDAVSLAVADVRHDTLVAFLTSGCLTCRGFWDALGARPDDVPGGARLVVVTRGPEAESPGAVASLAGSLPVVMSTEAWEHYDIPYAPYFVYISGSASRVMGEGVAAGWEEVKQLLRNAVADGTTTPPTGKRWHQRSAADQVRDEEADRLLAAAGIEPGDPRLYPTSIDESRPSA